MTITLDTYMPVANYDPARVEPSDTIESIASPPEECAARQGVLGAGLAILPGCAGRARDGGSRTALRRAKTRISIYVPHSGASRIRDNKRRGHRSGPASWGGGRKEMARVGPRENIRNTRDAGSTPARSTRHPQSIVDGSCGVDRPVTCRAGLTRTGTKTTGNEPRLGSLTAHKSSYGARGA